MEVKDNQFIYTNHAFDQMFGYGAKFLNEEYFSILETLKDQNILNIKDKILPLDQNINVWKGELKNFKSDGTVFWSSLKISFIDHPEYKNLIISVFSDISEHKKMEEFLLHKRKQIDELVKYPTKNPNLVLRISYTGEILYANPASNQIIETLNYKQENFIGSPMIEKIQLCVQNNRQMQFELKVNNSYFLMDLAPFQEDQIVIAYGIDITDKKKTENEILRSQKIESISLLAGGIAHDFNNLLAGILGNTNLLQLDENIKDESQVLLSEIEKSIIRTNALTRQLLTFSKGGTPLKNTESIMEIIKESAAFVLHGSKSKFILENEKKIPPVEVDIGQISQVLNNLLINADQSMPQGGLISIYVDTVKSVSIPQISDKRGSSVRIQIKDQGIGIPIENFNQIFSPYFTTKIHENGLGLATSYSIIKNHGGYLTFTSEKDKGTLFSIFLPTSKKKKVKNNQKKQLIQNFCGNVLIIDDDSIIIKFLEKMLKRIGFKVEIAHTGVEGILKYQKSLNKKEPFTLIICDLTIPGDIGGKEAMVEILKLNPEAKGIVSSGYSNDQVMARYKKYGFKGFLNKPYTYEELKHTIISVLS